ncbi:hypothetical protein VTN02DRAFT_6826 [Thermoascus thermophilus]
MTIGVLRSDGLVEPLPPIRRLLDEVSQILHASTAVDVRVIDLPVPPALKRCQALAGRLMSVDGGGPVLDLMAETCEPPTPWLQGRMARRTPLTVEQLCRLQSERTAVEREMMKLWMMTGGEGEGAERTRTVDAIICPVAPHPVPQIDRYNAIGYTSAWVLLDYPAGTVPVRRVIESDLELGREMTAPVLGSWDRRNRELWDETTVDRSVYLDSPLSIQVVTPRQHDYELCRAMDIIDRAVRESRAKRAESKL